VNVDGSIDFRDKILEFAGLNAGENITTSITYDLADSDETDTATISMVLSGAGDPNTAPGGSGILLDAGEDTMLKGTTFPIFGTLVTAIRRQRLPQRTPTTISVFTQSH